MQRKLKEVREERGVMKKALVELLNITYPTYQKWEENPALMPAGDFAKVCEFLHCSREDIFLG